ncbi:hypothetical protein Q1695_015127 [Nippostrongylus brasiliensis]|nr:hypothetical protein Q1695_015127 [Nippostrongylus brasiliensis]
MGITGLWPLLEPTCEPVTLEMLEGKVLAVDVSIWIYQSLLGYPADVRNPHLALLVSRLCKLLFYKIKPVFVFDGEGVPSFKRRVLTERQLKKHNEEFGITQSKKRTLLDLATGPKTDSEVEAIKNKLSAASSKRQRLENDLFDILPPKPVELIKLSDDDEDIVVIDTKERESPTLQTVDVLLDERERMKNSRLKPSQIPSDSKTFSNFQLQRLLVRSRLGDRIKELCENRDAPLPNGSQASDYWQSYTQHPLFPGSDNEEDSSSSDSQEADFYSKTSMVEDHVKRTSDQRKAETALPTLRCDDWSSDSSTDDFIDVPSSDSFVEQYLQRDQEAKIKEEACRPSTSGNAGENHSSDSFPSDVQEEFEPEIHTTSFDGVHNFGSNPVSTRESGLYEDLQQFLTACGFPWIEAPGEAEAQCVQLESLGLVQGVISDDSDVWAFGVKNVYRHLFSKNKNVQHYQSRVIHQSLGLTQSDFVGIAVLSGSDYSSGLAGVGVVNAVELLSEFAVARPDEEKSSEQETVATLMKVKQWMVPFDSQSDPPEPIALRRKLRSVIKKNNEYERIKSVVNEDVIAAYFRPNVDKSREKFRWRSVDVERVRTLLYSKLGWDDEHFEKKISTALQRWNEFITGKASYQRHITSYSQKLVQSPDEQRTKLTKRVETALAKLAKRTGTSSQLSALQSKAVEEQQEHQSKKARPVSRRTRPRRKAAKPPVELDLSEESDSDNK